MCIGGVIVTGQRSSTLNQRSPSSALLRGLIQLRRHPFEQNLLPSSKAVDHLHRYSFFRDYLAADSNGSEEDERLQQVQPPKPVPKRFVLMSAILLG